MPTTQDNVFAIVARISAPYVYYGFGQWEAVAAEVWSDKAEAAGHLIEATDWEYRPRGLDAVARVQIEGQWLAITYAVEDGGARIYAAPEPGQDGARV